MQHKDKKDHFESKQYKHIPAYFTLNISQILLYLKIQMLFYFIFTFI